MPKHLKFPNLFFTNVVGAVGSFPMCFINIQCVVSLVVALIIHFWNVDGQRMRLHNINVHNNNV